MGAHGPMALSDPALSETVHSKFEESPAASTRTHLEPGNESPSTIDRWHRCPEPRGSFIFPSENPLNLITLLINSRRIINCCRNRSGTGLRRSKRRHRNGRWSIKSFRILLAKVSSIRGRTASNWVSTCRLYDAYGVSHVEFTYVWMILLTRQRLPSSPRDHNHAFL